MFVEQILQLILELNFLPLGVTLVSLAYCEVGYSLVVFCVFLKWSSLKMD